MIIYIPSGLVLNDFVNHFEPLYYDHILLKEQQNRMKRSLKNPEHQKYQLNNRNSYICLNFTAHNKVFRLKMKKDPLIFAADVVFESTNKGSFLYDTNSILRGFLEGMLAAYIHV